MTELKRRLMETEAQMSRILQAMEVIQQKVGSVAADTADVMVCFCYFLLVVNSLLIVFSFFHISVRCCFSLSISVVC